MQNFMIPRRSLEELRREATRMAERTELFWKMKDLTRSLYSSQSQTFVFKNNWKSVLHMWAVARDNGSFTIRYAMLRLLREYAATE